MNNLSQHEALSIALADAKRFRAFREAAINNDRIFLELFEHNANTIEIDSEIKFNRAIDATMTGERITG